MNAMQIVLLAAGGLLLLKYFSSAKPDSGTTPSGAGNNPAGSGSMAEQTTAYPNGVQTEAVETPSDEALMKAALARADAPLAGAFKLNWWQWNYYRSRGAESILGIENPDPAIYAPKLDDKLQVSPEQMLTANQYHDLLDQFGGLSGLMWSWR